MKRIVITGGSGRLGQHVIADLVASGYEVLSVDMHRPDKLQCRFLQVDLTDAAAVYDVMAGFDAVIHLGAIPGPTSQPSSVTYRNNVSSTFNVAEAAAAHQHKKIVFASSVFTLGWHESPSEYWPEYVPVDEDHPLTPFESYGLSKVIGEETIATVSRRASIPAISLRIMNVIQTDAYFALPWPIPSSQQGVRFVLWPYVDVRDAARSCRLALEAKTTGHEALYIAAEDIRFETSTQSLLNQFAPHVKLRKELHGSESVISIEKAKRLIGYMPQHSWRMYRSAENS
jgi:nucleoside-diphosphate-sugar epimerase